MAMRSGYLVTIKGFIPVDHKDLAAHRQVLDALDAAKGGDTAPLFKLMEVEQFDVKPINRRSE